MSGTHPQSELVSKYCQQELGDAQISHCKQSTIIRNLKQLNEREHADK